MAALTIAPFVLLAIFSGHVLSSQPGFYWQDYHSDCIPKDAVVGGKDLEGHNLYIGQAYVKGKGIVVVQIKQGDTEVFASLGGMNKVSTNIKILCGRPESFYWMNTTCKLLHDMMENRKAVPGGHEDGVNGGMMNIGRSEFDGELKIGKVNTFQLNGDSFFFFNNNGEEKLLTSYEILMYNDTASTVSSSYSDEKEA